MSSLTETIAAIATAPGEGALAIVRLSGPDSATICLQFLRSPSGQPVRLHARRATLCAVVDEGGAPVDQAVVTFFPAPRSYTGEEMVELSVHGGPLPSRLTLEQCLRCGARLAEPGEFTLRAFLAGRMDLSQSEAVIETVQAQTRSALRLAQRQLSGRIAGRVHAVQAVVMKCLAQLEASIDFPEDVEDPDRLVLSEELRDAAEQCSQMAAEAELGRIYREGVRVVITGKPNVGKSSLLNALLREDRAIVTPVPGTTRDTLEETASIGGVPVRLIDTAGLRQTLDPVEQLGVDRALQSIRLADLCVVVLDRSDGFTSEDASVLRQTVGKKTLIVINKCDLPAVWRAKSGQTAIMIGEECFFTEQWPAAPMVVEAAIGVGQNIAGVEEKIVEMLFNGHAIPADALDTGSTRHAVALDRAARSLHNASATARSDELLDMVSVDLQGALHAMGEVTGETATEDLLHQIFSRFCIGK